MKWCLGTNYLALRHNFSRTALCYFLLCFLTELVIHRSVLGVGTCISYPSANKELDEVSNKEDQDHNRGAVGHPFTWLSLI